MGNQHSGDSGNGSREISGAAGTRAQRDDDMAKKGTKQPTKDSDRSNVDPERSQRGGVGNDVDEDEDEGAGQRRRSGQESSRESIR